MRFSQRIGKTPIKINVQKDSIDDDLRIGLWNAFSIYIASRIKETYLHNTSFNNFFTFLWIDFFKNPIDNLYQWSDDIINYIKKWFFQCEWYEVYDFLEFIIQYPCPLDKGAFKDYCNSILEKEVSAYRFIGNKIGEITNENEIKEIEYALDNATKFKFEGVKIHLETSLAMLTNRKNPDYRNSIKESISAVESIAQIISGDSKADLSKALKKIEDKIEIHPALKKGFIAIYGYTSDQDGIRHAMLEIKDISFEDAKYMLISCSAFINYLIIKANKAKVFM